jgi:hypothetical protein
MKRILVCGTAALALGAGGALAGGLAEPEMEQAVVVEQTSSSSGGILVPLLLLLIVVAAVASDSGGGGGAGLSDRRLKTDLHWVGMTRDGMPLWQWRYRGSRAVFEGVMAQDVAQRRPDALITRPGGLMGVDYTRLGFDLRRVA